MVTQEKLDQIGKDIYLILRDLYLIAYAIGLIIAGIILIALLKICTPFDKISEIICEGINAIGRKVSKL